MPTIKIGNPPPPPCNSSEHNPPTMMLWDPGTYKHTCPSCGNVIIFTIQGFTC